MPTRTADKYRQGQFRIGTTVRIALTGIGADTMIPPLMARRTTLISDFMSIEQWFGMTHLVLCEENS